MPESIKKSKRYRLKSRDYKKSKTIKRLRNYKKFSQSRHYDDSSISQTNSVNSESNSQISTVTEQSIALASQEHILDEDQT